MPTGSLSKTLDILKVSAYGTGGDAGTAFAPEAFQDDAFQIEAVPEPVQVDIGGGPAFFVKATPRPRQRQAKATLSISFEPLIVDARAVVTERIDFRIDEESLRDVLVQAEMQSILREMEEEEELLLLGVL